MTKVDIDLEGLDDLEEEIDDIQKRMPEAVGAGLYEIGQRIATTSKRKTPVDTGALRASMFVGTPSIIGNGISVTAGYGKEYALDVHESSGALAGKDRADFVGIFQTTGKGQFWDPNAEPRFLAKAFKEHASDADEQLRKAVRFYLVTGGGIMPTQSQFSTKPSDPDRSVDGED